MVKQERLDFLADSPFYTKRFAFFVGRRCRVSTIQDVARETAAEASAPLPEGGLAGETTAHATPLPEDAPACGSR